MKNNFTLPMPAAVFIPHRPPMQLVDTLISCANAGGVIEATLPANCILANADGTLDEVTLVELLAQSYAVIKGYDDMLQGKDIMEGFLVGIRRLHITGRASAGEKLQIYIRTVGSFEGFAVAEGEVLSAGETIASGSIKLWIVGGGETA